VARYAVLRIAKVKTMGHVAGLGLHVERERETRNADEARRTQNERLAGTGDWSADVARRLADAPTIRTNAVLAIEHVMTASPEFFAAGDERRVAAWRDASMAWLRETYGERNVVAAVLHRDELTPHIQALVVPIDDHGRLNARGFIGGDRGRLSALQDSYHEAVGRLGLERGVRGSVAEHQTVKEYYAKISEPTPARGAVLRAVEIERPGRFTRDLEGWAEEQRERVVERIAPAVDAALAKARHYEEQAARAEANVIALQQRVQTLERQQDRLTRDYRALAERVRDIVLRALGASQDRHDAHKWHTEAGVLNVTGAKFYNHSEGRGGGGAIDLVEHVAGYDFKGATAYLADRFGADAAAGAAVAHQAPAFRGWAERSAPPAFAAPEEDAGRWGRCAPTWSRSGTCRRRSSTRCTTEATSTRIGAATRFSRAATRRGPSPARRCAGPTPAARSRGWRRAAGARRASGPTARAWPSTRTAARRCCWPSRRSTPSACMGVE